MDARATFFKVYANLQLDLRKEIILTIKESGGYRPITWNVAFEEISNNTALGEKILKKIVELGLI